MKKRGQKPKLLIEGERIYLREFRPEDVNGSYLRWLKDKEVTQYTEIRLRSNSKEEVRSYVEKITNDPQSLFLAIITKNKDRHIGNIKLGPIKPVHLFADIGIIIGEKEF